MHITGKLRNYLIKTLNIWKLGKSGFDSVLAVSHLFPGYCCELDSVVGMAETNVLDGILTGLDSLVILRVEQAKKSANASSTRNLSIVVLDLDLRVFSEYKGACI